MPRQADATSSSASAISASTPTARRANPSSTGPSACATPGPKSRSAKRAATRMVILGIGGLGGDAACAALKDGELVAAIEESKLARQRTHRGDTAGLPFQSIAACLELARANPEQVDAIAVVRPVPDPDFHLKLRAQFP